VELSELLLKLTKRMRNVTLILDCCHAARMARGSTVVKVINPEHYPGISKHINRFLSGIDTDQDFFKLYPEGNSNVVRVVAAAASEMALEKRFRDSHRGCS
jgi:hypothetical protein